MRATPKLARPRDAGHLAWRGYVGPAGVQRNHGAARGGGSMRRLHLFELEDQAWFPTWMRDAGTAYISKIVELTGMLDGACRTWRRGWRRLPNRSSWICAAALAGRWGWPLRR